MPTTPAVGATSVASLEEARAAGRRSTVRLEEARQRGPAVRRLVSNVHKPQPDLFAEAMAAAFRERRH